MSAQQKDEETYKNIGTEDVEFFVERRRDNKRTKTIEQFINELNDNDTN